MGAVFWSLVATRRVSIHCKQMKRFTLGNRLNSAGDSGDVYRSTLVLLPLKGVEAHISINSYLALVKGCFWRNKLPARYVGLLDM